MNKAEKTQYIDNLSQKLEEAGVFYLADTSELTVEVVNNLRRECFKKDITMEVVKNTLLKKAMEKANGKEYGELLDILTGPTSIMFSEVGSTPAKVIQGFRKKNAKPVLKGAWIDEAIFIGDENLKSLAELKSKDELIGDVIALLQSPIKNVVSGLQSSGSTIAGIVKTLQEKEN